MAEAIYVAHSYRYWTVLYGRKKDADSHWQRPKTFMWLFTYTANGQRQILVENISKWEWANKNGSKQFLWIKNLGETTNLSVEIMNSKRQVRETLGTISRLPFDVNVMLNLSIVTVYRPKNGYSVNIQVQSKRLSWEIQGICYGFFPSDRHKHLYIWQQNCLTGSRQLYL